MNKTRLIFGLLCGLLIGYPTIIAQDAPKVETVSTTNNSNASGKFAVVQFDNLVKRMPKTKQVYAELEKMSNTYQAQLAKMAKEGQDKYESLQTKGAAMDVPIRKVLEEEIMGIQQRIQTLQATAEQELQKKQGELIPIAEEMAKKIKQYGMDNKFTAIFYDNALVYSSMQDISDIIAKELGLPKENTVSTTPSKPAVPVDNTPKKPAPAKK